MDLRTGWSWVVPGVVLVGLLAGCAEERRVVYSLEWDVAGVARSASGTGWEIVTDLGYRVQLDAGFLSSHSAELIECDYRPQPLAWVPSWLGEALSPSPAFARHVLLPNPSAFRTSHVESLVAAETTSTSRVIVGNRRYCEVNYLVARAESSAAGLPTDLDMVGKSLYLVGMYNAPGAAAERFEIASTVASGRRAGLYPPGHFGDETQHIVLDGRAGDAVVQIRRRLATLFDGVDFARQPRHEWPHRILANLVDDLSFACVPEGGGER